MTATTTFTCNICGEESTRICARCTKDTCNNHLCEKCSRCSDCCECEITRDESVRPLVRPAAWEGAPELQLAPTPADAVAEETAPADGEAGDELPSPSNQNTEPTGDIHDKDLSR
jgi:hypothetical protein